MLVLLALYSTNRQRGRFASADVGEQTMGASVSSTKGLAAFGLRFRLPGYTTEIHRNTFNNDLARINGDSRWTCKEPAYV
jgi:hypothetical protein